MTLSHLPSPKGNDRQTILDTTAHVSTKHKNFSRGSRMFTLTKDGGWALYRILGVYRRAVCRILGAKGVISGGMAQSCHIIS